MKISNEEMTHLFEIYLRKGNVNPGDFSEEDDKPVKTKEFARQFGFEKPYEAYLQNKKEAETTFSDVVKKQAEQRMNDQAAIIRDRCRVNMAKGGVDIEKLFGKQPDVEQARQLLREQFKALGMDDKTIAKLGIDNIDEMLVNDREFTVVVEDTPANEKFFKEQGYQYERKDGKLHAQATIHIEEGVAVEDTDKARKALDDVDIEYIRMAQDRNPKGSPAYNFIPVSWGAFTYSAHNQASRFCNRILNSQLTKNTAVMMGLIHASAFINPVFTVAAFLMFRQMGVFRDKGDRKFAPDYYQRKALDKGLTVFGQQQRGGRMDEVYAYMHKGKMCYIPARDVRVPDTIHGVRLTADQRERFRIGELIELKDRKGNSWQVRIDVTQPSLVRDHYQSMKSDKTPTPVPTPRSSDEEKLQYIAQKGYNGINDIYGKTNINIARDRFLMKHGLQMTFSGAQQSMYRLGNEKNPDKIKNIKEEFNNFDTKLKDIATNVLNSQRQSSGRGL